MTMTLPDVVMQGPNPWVDPRTYGASFDYETVTGSMLISTTTVTVSTAPFLSTDVGKLIAVHGAGASGGILLSTIVAYISATQVTIGTPALTAVTNVQVEYGTDNTSAIQAALNSFATTFPGPVGGIVRLPLGVGWIGSQVVVPFFVEMQGVGTRATVLKAYPGFSNTYMVQLGSLTNQGESCKVTNFGLDCSGLSGLQAGVYSQTIQEGSGVRHFVIVNFCNYGIWINTTSNPNPAQNYELVDIELYPLTAVTSASTSAIRIDGSGTCVRKISGITAVGNSGTTAAATAIALYSSPGTCLHTIHVESYFNGVTLNNVTGATEIDNFAMGPSLTNGVVISSDSNSVVCTNLFNAFSSPTLIDHYASGLTLTGNVPLYSSLVGRMDRLVSNVVFVGNNNGPDAPAAYALQPGTLMSRNNAANPNVIAWNGVNFGTDTQGGFFSTNSVCGSDGTTWSKTSIASSNNALFMRMAAALFELRFGQASNTRGAGPGLGVFSANSSGVGIGNGIAPAYALHGQGGPWRVQYAPAVTCTISQVGTAGTTTNTYWVVANTLGGGKVLCGPFTTNTSNASPSSTNYDLLTITQSIGAISYDLLRGSTPSQTWSTGYAPTSSSSTFTVSYTGQGLLAYTPPSRNTSADITVDGTTFTNHLVSAGSSPTVVAGPGVGTGSGASVQIVGTDQSGYVKVVTGSSPSGSNAVIGTVSFATPFDAVPKPVQIWPANSAANALQSTGAAPYADVGNNTTGGWVLSSGATALSASATYYFGYGVAP